MQLNLFAEENSLEKLSKLGDSLEKLKEMFRPELTSALRKEKRGPGGRPPYDYVMLFKILVLQRIYNISDDQTEFQINDRMSFMRFLGLSLGDKVPDAKTIWLFRENLTRTDTVRKLFDRFEEMLATQNIITHTGTIVDATFIDAPRQRNTREENKKIKEGETPEEWLESKPEVIHKKAQKDVDARWVTKGKERHYGYKNHAKVDADSKMICYYAVTVASVHDSNEFVDFFNEADRVVYADSAYTSAKISASLRLPSLVCRATNSRKRLS